MMVLGAIVTASCKELVPSRLNQNPGMGGGMSAIRILRLVS